MPWSYQIFVNDLGLSKNSISFETNNAFSFEFGKNVHIALIDEYTELFVVKVSSKSDAKHLASQFLDGFHVTGRQSSKRRQTICGGPITCTRIRQLMLPSPMCLVFEVLQAHKSLNNR